MGDNASVPFVTLRSRQPADGSSFSSGDSAYGSSLGEEKTPSATHDISRVSYHVKHLPEFAKTLEDSATRAFPNRGGSQRYKKVHALLLHWRSDDLFVLPELEDLEACFREDFNFETETFPIPSENPHLDLMMRVGAMIKQFESSDTLFVIYYGGHARIDESRQSTWCATRSSDSPTLQWSAIQTLLERSLSDVLILLDCCAGAASATFPNGNSVTETISASSWDAIAPDPGRYSFTNALIEVLQEWKRRTFSAAMLHAEVLARLKHPRPIMLNGKHFEARSTPVHFMMTANHRAPSIEMSRIIPPGAKPPTPPQEPQFENPGVGRSAGPQDIIGSEPNEDVPHVMISLALEEDQRLNINDWEQWLGNIPALAKYVRVQGVFKSHSTLLLLSMPVMVWDLLPENHACNFVGFIRSNNLAARNPDELNALGEEVLTGDEMEADFRSIYSGTTAYTALPGARLSTYSAASSRRGSFEPGSIYRTVERPRYEPSIRSHRTKLHVPPVNEAEMSTWAWQRSPPRRPSSLRKRHSSREDTAQIQQPPVSRSRSFKGLFSHAPRTRPELPSQVQARLEEYFQNNTRPTIAVKEFLASTLGTDLTDIDIWFYHRREQQEVSSRLQNLKIDGHSHEQPKAMLQMILPYHLNKLLEILSDGQVLQIDLRSNIEYDKSHIRGAINLRMPSSFTSRATMDMIEKALPDEASQKTFSKWDTNKCVVFYDRVLEYPWEAPTAEALCHKFKNKGWVGECFLLKGHYREFSQSFDNNIVGPHPSENDKDCPPESQKTSEEMNKVDLQQQYNDWLKQLEGEDRVHSTELPPSVRQEREETLFRQQKQLEEEFSEAHPSLFRAALDLKPDKGWNLKAAMVAPLERGIAKIQETTRHGLHEGGRSSAPPGGSFGHHQHQHQGNSATGENRSSSVGEDYDLLESDDDHGHPMHEPGFQKIASASSGSIAPSSHDSTTTNTTTTAHKKKGRAGLGSGHGGLLNKLIRSGRSDLSR